VRVTRTKGSGPSQTTSYSTGGISINGLSPTGRVAGSRLTVSAIVWDQSGTLSRSDIRLYFDGSEISRFHYDQASGKLTYYVGRALSAGTHEMEIEAGSFSSHEKGRSSGTARRRWTFTVVRR
jgi:hypothetical protein